MTPADLEQLYDAHAAALFHYFLGFTKREMDARDLLQDLFVKLAREVRDHGEWRSERAFLYRSAHHLAVDWFRRRGARERLEDAAHLERMKLFDPGADPDAPELSKRMAEALLALPEEQRSVAQMKLWCGLTFEEIAEAQGIPLNTAASRYRYAIDKLRALLRPIYEELR
jgi:RNA polymerase sigma-70 factor (ECF subfamily)